ncbi:MAG: GNAT family N-acetyltransferase [Anaerolineae bacterium]|jgi:predicted acetyltransferase|nr:GNAT family N-acetyltransferase [Anaerolineae bacterium]
MPKIVQLDPETSKDEVTRLWWKCFNPDKTVEEVAKWAHRDLDEMEILFGVRDKGQLVAVTGATKHIENRFRGADLRFSGIGGVATLPEYRRGRWVRRMMEAFFQYANENDIIVSALAPFNYPFYEKFGYVMSEQRHDYHFSPSELKQITGQPEISFREYDPEKDAEAVMDVQRSMARFGSRLFIPLHRLQKFPIPHGYVFERNHEIVGFILLRFNEIKEDWQLRMNIIHTWFNTNDVLPAIADFVFRYGSQCKQINWRMEPEIPLEYFLKNPGHQERRREGGMMVRVVKFKEFCQQIKVPLAAAEPVTVKLVDVHCPWNEGVWELTPVASRLGIQSCTKEPEIVLDAIQLSHTLAGIITAAQLQSLGGLDCSADAAERFSQIFPAQSHYYYARF